MNIKLITSLVLSLAIILLTLNRANAGERHALVVGNSKYQHAGVLANPQNDAELMAETLITSGFIVTKIIDADYRTFKRNMLEFGRKLRGDNIDAGLFYYAGHGIQVRGENYLIPVNAQINSQDEVDLEGININDFLQVMNSSDSKVNIVVLDACRNNPFARSFRSISRGLAPVQAPKGTYIAYATAPGDVASDGQGTNSPYTLALTKAMGNPGVPIERVFKSARVEVLNMTDEKQVPWEVSSITGEFYFNLENDESPQPKNQQPVKPKQEIASLPKEIPIQHNRAPNMARCEKKQYNVGVSRGVVCASSQLSSQSGNSYAMRNLFDNNMKTAWVEGVKGQGTGESLLVKFDQPTTVRRVELVNGYNKSKSLFAKNSRIGELGILTSTGTTSRYNLNDTMGWQSFDTPQPEKIEWMELTIESVFIGNKYKDTAISELRLQ